MNGLSYARRNIVFNEQTPIFGAFDDSKYRFIAKPLLRLDDIDVKQQIIYKASSALGTITLQIATAYRLDMLRKSMLLVAQSDDDADEWAKTRIRPFLERLPSLKDTVLSGRTAITNTMWQWANHYAIISGPGVNAQNSKQVCFVHTDEAHLYNAGTLAAFDDRMGGRWDRASLHVTTAADAGHEIDQLYFQGDQNEWHHVCVHCGKLFWLLWNDQAEKLYGHRVFLYDEDGGDNATLESLKLVCPNCHGEMFDTPNTRLEMDEGADYVSMNPSAVKSVASYRWNCFAVRWRSWQERLTTYLLAIKSARIGNFKPHENWVKKHLCESYTNEIPELNKITTGGDSRVVWDVKEDKTRVCSFDVQGGEFHLWALCDEFDLQGNSRRVAFARLTTWQQAREFQLYNNVQDVPIPNPQCLHPFVACDYGYRYTEVFSQCAQYRWLALKSGDNEAPIEFTHLVSIRKLNGEIEKKSIILPYSPVQMQDGNAGKKGAKVQAIRGIPKGWCASRQWSKSAIGFIVLRLLNKSSEREYIIDQGFSSDFISQVAGYIEINEPAKKNSLVMIRKLRKVKEDEHAFTCASQNILLAIIAGYFPMDFAETQQLNNV